MASTMRLLLLTLLLAALAGLAIANQGDDYGVEDFDPELQMQRDQR